MPTLKHTRGLTRAAGTLVLLASGAFSIIGCANGSPPPDVVTAPYDGPPLRVETAEGLTQVVASPNSPGWTILLDRVLEGHGFHSAFISVKRPNPTFAYPPTPVEQHLATSVPIGRPLKIYARLADWNNVSPIGDSYTLVVDTPTTPAAPTTPTPTTTPKP
ncbi:MAG: hypothetical protein JSR77_13425 [Planctomycetes bacterium]|nr:hypothetical protein [Planctomycetota bacterium]